MTSCSGTVSLSNYTGTRAGVGEGQGRGMDGAGAGVRVGAEVGTGAGGQVHMKSVTLHSQISSIIMPMPS